MKKSGFCAHCNASHAFDVTGAFRYSGLLCSAGIALGMKRADAALIAGLVSLLFGDAIEEWVKARCPECGVALQVVSAVTT